MKTQIILATKKVFETQEAAQAANAVGALLLPLSANEYGLAVGNIINREWTFEWATSTKTLYEERLLQPYPVPVEKVPETPGIPVLYSPEERAHMENAYTKGFISATDYSRGPGRVLNGTKVA